MKLYFAPMEGITTYLFRNAYHAHFDGADKYFTPFLSNSNMTRRDESEILPEHNRGMTVIPQILTNRAEEFLAIARRVADLGYDTVNLNLGCPSGTVVAKKRGAGLLADPTSLDRFLDQIYEACPLHISIKTRIGISHLSEWEDLLRIYRKYPIEELIIHPRLQQDFYNGTPHYSAYRLAVEMLADTSIPLCYNGDIRTLSEIDALRKEHPGLDAVMIGRGLIADPGMLCGGTNTDALEAFLNELMDEYEVAFSGCRNALFRMKENWANLHDRFEDSDKLWKKMRKTTDAAEFRRLSSELLHTCPMK